MCEVGTSLCEVVGVMHALEGEKCLQGERSFKASRLLDVRTPGSVLTGPTRIILQTRADQTP